MSTYQNSLARLRAAAAVQVSQLLQSHETDIAALFAAQQVIQEASTPELVQESLHSMSGGVHTALAQLAPAEWAVAQARASQPAATADAVAAAVNAAFEAAEQKVGDAVRSVLTSAIEEFVQEPGQGFASANAWRSGDLTVIEGRREGSEEVARFAVDSHGALQRVYLQHQGVSCQDRDAQLLDFLATKGIALETVASDVHGGKRDKMYADAAGGRRQAEIVFTAPAGTSIFDAPAASVRKAGGAA